MADSKPFINVRIYGHTIENLRKNGIVLDTVLNGLGLPDISITEGSIANPPPPQDESFLSTSLSQVSVPRYSTPIYPLIQADLQRKFTLGLPRFISNIGCDDECFLEEKEENEDVEKEVERCLNEVLEMVTKKIVEPEMMASEVENVEISVVRQISAKPIPSNQSTRCSIEDFDYGDGNDNNDRGEPDYYSFPVNETIPMDDLEDVGRIQMREEDDVEKTLDLDDLQNSVEDVMSEEREQKPLTENPEDVAEIQNPEDDQKPEDVTRTSIDVVDDDDDEVGEKTEEEDGKRRIMTRAERKKKTSEAEKQRTMKYLIKCEYPRCGFETRWMKKYGRVRLYEHALIHSKTNYMKCEKCKETFQTVRQLRLHYQRRHKSAKMPMIRAARMITNTPDLENIVTACYQSQINLFQRDILNGIQAERML